MSQLGVNRTITLFLHPLLKDLYCLLHQTICTWVVRCLGNVLEAIFFTAHKIESM